MGFPELDPDEPVILESGNVRFNSLSFDAILTNKRIHLTDSRKNVIPSRDIPLAIIRNVENGENAIRDHFLILSLVTGTGEKSQVVLTFARQSGVERKRECNEWAKKLKSFISSASPVIAPSDVPEPDRTPLPQREVPTKVQGSETGIRPANKKIPPARPQRTIIEKSSRVPEPVEVTTLPSGSFCSQCGTRVPLKSTFCSHCGVPFKQPSGRAQEPQPVVTKVPEPVKPPAPKPVVIKVQERPTPQPVVTNVPEPVRPLGSQPFVTKVPDLVRPQGSQPVVTKVPEPVRPQVSQPVVTKVPEPVRPQVSQPVVTKVPEPVQPPAPQPVVTKVPEPVQPPAPQPVVTKVPEPVRSLALLPVDTKIQKTIQPPAPQPVATKVPEPVQPPAPKPVATKVLEPVQPPAPEPVTMKAPEPVRPLAPQPVATKVPESVRPPAPQPVATKVPESVRPPAPESVVIKEQETVQAPAVSPGELQGSSIEPITPTLEPPVKASVPSARHPSEPTSSGSPAGSSPQVIWPVFSYVEYPAAPAQDTVPAGPASPPPSPAMVPRGKKPDVRVIGILIMAILPVLVGLVIVANLMSGPSGGPATVTPVIPVVTTLRTQQPQTTSTPVITSTPVPGSTQVMIPSNGIWVRASYPGTYSGLIGTPGNQLEVTDSGDHVYPIPMSAGTVTASLEKEDGSGNQIILEVYRDGVMLKRESNITPKGIVEIQLDLSTL